MSFPFSKCPHISAFTEETDSAQWNQGTITLTAKHDMILYHESAEALYHTRESVISVAAGSVLFVPSMSNLNVEITKSGSVICIGFESVSTENSQLNLSLVLSASPSNLRNRFLHFAAMRAQPPTTALECAMLSEFYGILYELQRNTPDGNREVLRIEKIRPSVAYLENHLTDRGLNLKQIAALSDISETYFRALFVEQYGKTPLQYLIEKRVEKAAKLLRESELSLPEIQRICGFHSHTYFVKQFTRIVGVSPTDIRKK